MESVLDSGLGESYKSTPFPKPGIAHRYPPPSDPVPITGSLPSRTNQLLPSMSMVFGRNKNDQISKSWCDLWDEEEESENEELSAFQQRRGENSRSWSQESQNMEILDHPNADLTESESSMTLQAQSPGPRAPALDPESSAVSTNPVDIRREPTPRKDTTPSVGRSSPKKSALDKWAALGDKRRGAKPRGGSLGNEGPAQRWRKDWGLGSSGFNYGSWVRKDSPTTPDRRSRPYLQKDWRRDAPESAKPRPPSGYDGSVDEDLDLVGGWHDLHL